MTILYTGKTACVVFKFSLVSFSLEEKFYRIENHFVYLVDSHMGLLVVYFWIAP